MMADPLEIFPPVDGMSDEAVRRELETLRAKYLELLADRMNWAHRALVGDGLYSQRLAAGTVRIQPIGITLPWWRRLGNHLIGVAIAAAFVVAVAALAGRPRP